MIRNLIIAVLFLAVIVLVGWNLSGLRAESVGDITSECTNSGHADRTSLAFRDWDDEEPPEIPPNCAKCHSTIGYLDFLGADGSTPDEVDRPSPIGTTIECTACHNEVSDRMESVEFPSQVVITDLDGQGNCMQ